MQKRRIQQASVKARGSSYPLNIIAREGVGGPIPKSTGLAAMADTKAAGPKPKRINAGQDPIWKVELQRAWKSHCVDGNGRSTEFIAESIKIAKNGTAACPFGTLPPKKSNKDAFLPSHQDDREFSPSEVSNFSPTRSASGAAVWRYR